MTVASEAEEQRFAILALPVFSKDRQMQQIEHVDYESKPSPPRPVSIFWRLALLIVIPGAIWILYEIAVAPEGPGSGNLDTLLSGNTVLDGPTEALVCTIGVILSIAWVCILFWCVAKLRRPPERASKIVLP